MQVVTPENFVQLIQTGKVDDFKAPEAPVAEVKAEVKPAAVADDAPRNADGTFKALDTATEKTDKAVTADAKADAGKTEEVVGATEEGDPNSENYGDDLPEKARKKIGNKHRLMREAEELAEREFDRRKA